MDFILYNTIMREKEIERLNIAEKSASSQEDLAKIVHEMAKQVEKGVFIREEHRTFLINAFKRSAYELEKMAILRRNIKNREKCANLLRELREKTDEQIFSDGFFDNTCHTRMLPWNGMDADDRPTELGRSNALNENDSLKNQNEVLEVLLKEPHQLHQNATQAKDEKLKQSCRKKRLQASYSEKSHEDTVGWRATPVSSKPLRATQRKRAHFETGESSIGNTQVSSTARNNSEVFDFDVMNKFMKLYKEENQSNRWHSQRSQQALLQQLQMIANMMRPMAPTAQPPATPNSFLLMRNAQVQNPIRVLDFGPPPYRWHSQRSQQALPQQLQMTANMMRPMAPTAQPPATPNSFLLMRNAQVQNPIRENFKE